MVVITALDCLSLLLAHGSGMNCVSHLFLDVLSFFCIFSSLCCKSDQFYIHKLMYVVCVTSVYKTYMEHLCFNPISTELSEGFCQNHIAIFSSFLLNPRDRCSFMLLFHILLSFLCSLDRQLLQTPEGFDYRPPAI